MRTIAELFDDRDIWRYLHIAHRLEMAGVSIVESLQDGKTVEDVKKGFEGDHFAGLTAEDIAFGVVFGQLLMPERARLISDYEALRYDFKELNSDDWRSIKETLSRQLNRRG